MNTFWIAFASSVLLVAAMGVMGTLRQARLAQALVFSLTMATIAVLWVSLIEQQGRPKPVALEWWMRHADEAAVLGSQMDEGKQLYLWLKVAGEVEPRAYTLPWDQKTAQQLQSALEEAARNGTQARMRLPFEPTLDAREPKFYAPPQPALPPKDLTDPPAQVYQQPGTEA